MVLSYINKLCSFDLLGLIYATITKIKTFTAKRYILNSTEFQIYDLHYIF